MGVTREKLPHAQVSLLPAPLHPLHRPRLGLGKGQIGILEATISIRSSCITSPAQSSAVIVAKWYTGSTVPLKVLLPYGRGLERVRST